MRHVCSLVILLSVLVSGCGGRQVSAQSAGLIPGTFFSTPPEEKEAQDGWVFATTGLALANTTTEAIEPFRMRITNAYIVTSEGKTYPAKPVGWRNLSWPMLDKDMQISFLPIYPGTSIYVYVRDLRSGEYTHNFHVEYQYAEAAHPTDLVLQVARPDMADDAGEMPVTTLTIPLGVQPELPPWLPADRQPFSLTELAQHLSLETDSYSQVVSNQCGQAPGLLQMDVHNKNQLDNLEVDESRHWVSYQTVRSDGVVWETIRQRVITNIPIGPNQTVSRSIQLPEYSDDVPYIIVNGSVYSLMCQ